MSSYWLIFAVIIASAILNLLSLYWVYSLQQKLSKQPKHNPKDADVMAQEVHQVMARSLPRLEQRIDHDLDSSLAAAAKVLNQDLAGTSLKINHDLEQMSDAIIREQLAELEKSLSDLRQASLNGLQSIQQVIEQRRTELENAMAAEIDEEKKKILGRVDTQLADIVSAFLIESLGNNVDLGAQSHYLFTVLEQNKADLKREIENEFSATR